MNKIYKIIIFLLITIYSLSSSSSAHLQHYNNLKHIEFDIFRNGKNIGKHIFSFKTVDDQLEVESEINFEIKKLGIVIYKYHVKGTEYYKNGELIKFNSKTNQNGKKKFVNMKIENGEYLIDGSSFKGKAPVEYLIGTWWNHSLIKSEAQISAVSGRIIKQTVTFLGRETIRVGEKQYETLHFNFSSTDNKLNKDKKLNTDIWYDEKSLNWVKATFEKKGKWEYKLTTLE